MENKLREKREALNLRLIDVAVKSGVGISTVWMIEHGYEKRASKKTKMKIAAGLEVKTEELFPEVRVK